MSEGSPYEVSQGYRVLPPKSGDAYPIPCSEWSLLKSNIGNIRTKFEFYHTAGAILLGAAISTFTSILCGSYTSTPAAAHPVIIAWAVVSVTLICGALCFHFARETRTHSNKQAQDVIAQMDLIETRYGTEPKGL